MDGVIFSYGSVDVLKEVHMEASPGEVLGILGPNASGKTTMLRCINGILAPKQGSIAIDGTDINSMGRIEISKKIGYVPQNPTQEMCTPTVYEVVLMGRRPHVVWEYGNKDREIAWMAIDEMGIKHISTQRFDRLSSGQTQRVLMARAIAQEVKMLLLDEPTSNLDVRYQIEVMRSIQNQVREKDIGACAVVHDLDLALRFCDKVILLNNGKIQAAGMTEEVITPENIRAAYGVDSAIEHIYGRPRIMIM